VEAVDIDKLLIRRTFSTRHLQIRADDIVHC